MADPYDLYYDAGPEAFLDGKATFRERKNPVKPKKEKPLKTRLSTEDLLVKLLAAIKATYPTDNPSAGLVLSDLSVDHLHLPQYASICRYPGGAKQVIHSTYKKTMREALIDLSRKLVGAELNEARQDLAKAVK